MKFNYLSTLTLASALVLTNVSGVVFPSPAEAESITEKTQLIAGKKATGNSFVSVEQGKETTGTATIVNEDGKRYIEFDEAFSTPNGPDLLVILHRQNTVDASIEEEDYVSIAPLESFSGKQRYAIPEDINLEEYGSIAIWCREFNVTFAYASL